ncbi:MAG: hypothetical protein JNM21_03090 [Taibaiella sp.]|nr:hypothetical protein [Taibaiella sp.]
MTASICYPELSQVAVVPHASTGLSMTQLYCRPPEFMEGWGGYTYASTELKMTASICYPELSQVAVVLHALTGLSMTQLYCCPPEFIEGWSGYTYTSMEPGMKGFTN